MSTLDSVRLRLLEISTAATVAAEALDAARVDFLDGELGRLLGRLDGVAERLVDACDRLAEGIDPQGGHLAASEGDGQAEGRRG